MKKLISILLAAGVAMPVFAQFYRTNNADTDWSNLENWTTDAEGTVPATSVPGRGNNVQWYLGDAAVGTKTVVTGDLGNISIDRLNVKSADLTFSYVNVNIGNRINFGAVDGATAATEDNRNTINVVLDNTTMKTWLCYFANQNYTDLNFTLKNNSTFQITATTWNQYQGVGSKYSTTHITIEKGSTFTTGTSLTTNGTHSAGQYSTSVMDVYGNLNAAAIYTTDQNTSTSTINIYGSANIVSTGSTNANQKNSYLNFIMQDVDVNKMTYITAGTVENSDVDAIFTTGDILNINRFTITVDVKDFSFDGDYDEGESYAIALFKLTNATETFSTDVISIVNADKMGPGWELADEALFWNESTLFLNVISVPVPEPSTYAAIFGALALAFAAYRRKR
ncbi:MAG: PEP-CTERM sorting domain-containing protein [Opitutales bacterium]|nr:PEP-CTERM sorting domain-containing protein [Opitutales bacterium]